MAKLLNTGERVPHTPADQLELEEGARKVYFLRAPSLYDRAKLDRAMRARGAVHWSEAQLLECMREGVAAILPDPADPGRQAAEAAIGNYRDRLLEDPAAALVAGDTAVGALGDILRRHWDKYAAMEADRAFWWEVLGVEACRLFLTRVDHLVGDEGVDYGHAGPADDDLMVIPPGHRLELGLKVLDMTRPTEAESKNSGSPSPGPRGGKSSTASRSTT